MNLVSTAYFIYLLVKIVDANDVNDNAPIFSKNTYTSEIYESDGRISPPLVVRATDADGLTQGDGFAGINYLIVATNLTGLTVDSISGEIKLTRPLNYSLQRMSKSQRKRLHFEAIVKAIDNRKPSRSSTAKVLIYVKSDRDGAPMFVNEPYFATVKENMEPNSVVIQVKATDPDGPDTAITYAIVDGARDNFVIDTKSGEIRLSNEGNLDKDVFGSHYELNVVATDGAMPIPLTSNTIVTIDVEDVNNKPPSFEKSSYTKFLPENELENKDVIQVQATDPDENAIIKYSIIDEETVVRDKAGLIVAIDEDFVHRHFVIDANTGVIRIVKKFDYIKPSIITLMIEAKDLNSLDKTQNDRTEVVIYIQSQDVKNPIFAYPWDPVNKTYKITVQEEGLVGSTILTLAAQDPITNLPITKFEKLLNSDPENFVSVSPVSGIVTLNRRLDYDEMLVKSIGFSVKAIGSVDNAESIAHVIVQVEDINDNSPIFSQDKYNASVTESAHWPHTVLSVKASDKDSNEYGSVKYSTSGDGSAVFSIDSDTGTITIKDGVVLDREKKSFYHLQITAVDGNNSSFIVHKRQTSVLVTINIVDNNDNAPEFEQQQYKSIVPENAPIGFAVGGVKANDPDEGPNGKVKYHLIDYDEAKSEKYFEIDEKTGVLRVNKLLAGKGSRDPYEVHIRASDHGTPQLFTDTVYSILIGDISINDGVPRFIKPAKDETITINENSKPGTFVYQVEAIDADNPNTPNGKIIYNFLESSPYFEIHPISGIIMTTTRAGYQLDREMIDNFTLILVASDLGTPPQESHRVLLIKINDLDDNEPFFSRAINSEPVVFEVKEEIQVNSVIGSIKAIDRDIDTNGLIEYRIVNGNLNDSFVIETNTNGSFDNVGVIKNTKILDSEKQANYTLVIKALSKASRSRLIKHEPYKPEDLSQLKVVIKLINVNDNPLSFEHQNYVAGVKLDVELNTELIICKAIDLDQAGEDSIIYSIYNATYIRDSKISVVGQVLEIDSSTGSIRNVISLRPYVGGYFNIIVQAKSNHLFGQDNPNDIAFANVKVFVLHSKDLLRFIFRKKPIEVQKVLPLFKEEFEKMFVNEVNPTSLYLYDTEYHQRTDGSLDFESSSSCFQLVRISDHINHNKVISSSEAMKLLKSNSSVKELFSKFGVTDLDNCTPLKSTYKISKSELGIIVIALSMAVITVICACVGSQMKRKFKKKLFSIGALASNSFPYGVPVNSSSIMAVNDHQRIFDWQESSPPLDAMSFRSFPTLR